MLTFDTRAHFTSTPWRGWVLVGGKFSLVVRNLNDAKLREVSRTFLRIFYVFDSSSPDEIELQANNDLAVLELDQ